MLSNVENKLVCIFGLGKTGISAARYLQRTEQEFFVVDSRNEPPGKTEVEALSNCQQTYFGEIPEQRLQQASMIILSPGVTPELPEIVAAKNAGVEVVGDIEIFVRSTSKKIVAITGSNGKSTVTDLTHRLLCAAGVNAKIGGNFGVPVLDYLPGDDAEVYVLELSSFQLDTTYSLQADVAVVLNITEDHMDRYRSFEHYRQSKLSIYRGALSSLVNLDDSAITDYFDGASSRYSLTNEKADFFLEQSSNDKQFVCNGKTLLTTEQLAITGSHNWSNVLASLGILSELKVDITQQVLEALRQYEGLAHRFQLISRKADIDWVNDSKATNVGATEAALDGVDFNHHGPVVLIAGGDAKGGDLSPLKPAFENKISCLVLIGKDAALFAQLAPKDKKYFATDMKQAVVKAKTFVDANRDSDKKPLVLLSPACASLDMYPNFEVRGQIFCQEVEALQ
ncbi:UDP-N-acetylmuramoyl-L-alanine--D-glutamate ligase [Aliikangiella coralliicola]|uniref:UDP-N-acetylmuramoylalanine--D-glutamate ligase n=1 Tax=Aliikangiella coralliicola TaxID=2592383 RepID=A0A545UK43_9GAMM|nr:UDP-N-acetylmuramoyl-L-alanine--D-glutamate ligase [Aliikangiella coralliicola]TQV89834.1 UDP-N-acetylmuramoyl-L-alanine--D-glutamate ligase [Aliikangiella coralliicola]